MADRPNCRQSHSHSSHHAPRPSASLHRSIGTHAYAMPQSTPVLARAASSRSANGYPSAVQLAYEPLTSQSQHRQQQRHCVTQQPDDGSFMTVRSEPLPQPSTRPRSFRRETVQEPQRLHRPPYDATVDRKIQYGDRQSDPYDRNNHRNGDDYCCYDYGLPQQPPAHHPQARLYKQQPPQPHLLYGQQFPQHQPRYPSGLAQHGTQQLDSHACTQHNLYQSAYNLQFPNNVYGYDDNDCSDDGLQEEEIWLMEQQHQIEKERRRIKRERERLIQLRQLKEEQQQLEQLKEEIEKDMQRRQQRQPQTASTMQQPYQAIAARTPIPVSSSSSSSSPPPSYSTHSTTTTTVVRTTASSTIRTIPATDSTSVYNAFAEQSSPKNESHEKIYPTVKTPNSQQSTMIADDPTDNGSSTRSIHNDNNEPISDTTTNRSWSNKRTSTGSMGLAPSSAHSSTVDHRSISSGSAHSNTRIRCDGDSRRSNAAEQSNDATASSGNEDQAFVDQSTPTESSGNGCDRPEMEEPICNQASTRSQNGPVDEDASPSPKDSSDDPHDDPALVTSVVGSSSPGDGVKEPNSQGASPNDVYVFPTKLSKEAVDQIDRDSAVARLLQKQENMQARKSADVTISTDQMDMLSTICGRAIVFVQTVCDAWMRELQDQPQAVKSAVRLVLREEQIVPKVEQFLEIQDIYKACGKPSKIDLGYYYTRLETIAQMRNHGIPIHTASVRDNGWESYCPDELSDGDPTPFDQQRAGGDRHRNPYLFGDGIYTTNTSRSFAARPDRVGVFVARLRGKTGTVRVAMPSRKMFVKLDNVCEDTEFDSLLGNHLIPSDSFPTGRHRNDQVVLKTSQQCFPLIQFPAAFEDTELLRRLHVTVQRVLDKVLNI